MIVTCVDEDDVDSATLLVLLHVFMFDTVVSAVALSTVAVAIVAVHR